MAENLQEVSACVASCMLMMMGTAVEVNRKRRKRRKCWVKPWIKLRPISGAYSSLIQDLMNSDQLAFQNYCRMDRAAFEELLSRVEHDLSKQQTRLRVSISARERLFLALRYLATGTVFFTLYFAAVADAGVGTSQHFCYGDALIARTLIFRLAY